MKILYVCHRFPFPPKRGGKIRPFNMIRHLHEQGHDVTVASHVRSPGEAEEGRGLADHCRDYLMGPVGSATAWAKMIALLPTPVPSSYGYFHSASLARQIRERLARERYDLVFVHCSSVAHYVANMPDVPKILDFGDMDSQKWLIYAKVRGWPLSMGYWLEGTKLARDEARLARRFDLCTCTTAAERETLDGYGTGAVTDWFPNGVDAEYFCPAGAPYDPDTITFIGRMDYFPNQDAMFRFCRETLPLIRARRPAVKLNIVGASPPPAVRRLGELEGVTVTGSVPDVRPYVHGSALTVAPLGIARGTQNKVLESMAMGVPAVVSREAAGGIDAVAGEHVAVAAGPEETRDAVLRLLEDPAERRRMAEAARARVLSHHDWEASMVRLDGIIERCLALRAPASAAGAWQPAGSPASKT